MRKKLSQQATVDVIRDLYLREANEKRLERIKANQEWLASWDYKRGQPLRDFASIVTTYERALFDAKRFYDNASRKLEKATAEKDQPSIYRYSKLKKEWNQKITDRVDALKNAVSSASKDLFEQTVRYMSMELLVLSKKNKNKLDQKIVDKIIQSYSVHLTKIDEIENMGIKGNTVTISNLLDTLAEKVPAYKAFVENIVKDEYDGSVEQ